MADFVVTTLHDELDAADTVAATADLGDLSLREALALANGDGATADTITFAAGLSGGTLFLANGELTIDTDGIIVDGDIDGDGTADIVIDADSSVLATDASSRIFNIDDGSAVTTIRATLNGLVIRDGVATDGGGIRLGTLDSLILTNTTVVGNRADKGGGIFGYGNNAITLTDSTVSGNYAGSAGGGIHSVEVSLGIGQPHLPPVTTLINSDVSNNSTAGDGGTVSYTI